MPNLRAAVRKKTVFVACVVVRRRGRAAGRLRPVSSGAPFDKILRSQFALA